MGKGSGNGTTRGDRKRNARRERLRGLLPRDGAVIGIGLAEDKQALAVIDHDVRVLARKTVKVKAFRLGEALDWAVAQARAKGFDRVAVACEPTGARWMQVQRLCRERGLPLVCIQPLVSHIAREQQDYMTHKTDEPDCVMIARLAVELHCYVPEELDETWGYLRQLGRRREQLITAETASMHRIREFLSVAWPAVLETCAVPLKSVTWLTAVQLVTQQCGGQPARLAAMGWQAFTAAVRAAVPDWGGKRAWRPIAVRVFDALTDTEGVVAWSRRGLLRRVADELADLQRIRAQPAALALLHGRPRHQLGRRGRRRPDLPARRPQQSGGGCLTSAYVPHPLRVPETFLPDEEESEPVPASGTTPCDTLGSSPPVAWSFSPARLNAVGAGLPGLSMGRPSPLALRRARRPR